MNYTIKFKLLLSLFLPLLASAQLPLDYRVDPTLEASSSPVSLASANNKPQTDIAAFKDKIQLAIAGSKNNFADIKGAPYKTDNDTFETDDCLPGASDCYLYLGHKKMYFANFGNYKDGITASEKANELKYYLLQALGKSLWHYSVLDKTGCIEEYEVWGKTTSSNFTRIRTYVQKTGGLYNVYLTVEEI